MRGLYRGYLLANLIAVLHLNLFSAFRNLYSSVRQGQTDNIPDILVSKDSVGALLALAVLHPLDTIK
jgi:hypothetical protein